MDELRNKLVDSICINGINSQETIYLSQELDKLIVDYMKMNRSDS